MPSCACSGRTASGRFHSSTSTVYPVTNRNATPCSSTATTRQRVQGPARPQRPRAHAARPHREGGPMMSLTIRAIGAPLDRIDGPKKVTGTATYTFEYPVEGVTYAFPVQSTIARGRIVSIDSSAARALPGVVTVLSHENAPRLTPLDDAELAVFQSDAVVYRGQFVAVVV